MASQGNHKVVDQGVDIDSMDKGDLYAKTSPSESLFFALGKTYGKNIGILHLVVMLLCRQGSTQIGTV